MRNLPLFRFIPRWMLDEGAGTVPFFPGDTSYSYPYLFPMLSKPLSVPVATGQPDWVVAGKTPPWQVLARLAQWPGIVWARRELLLTCVRRELQARFRGTVFGFAWVLLQPLIQFAIYAFIFTELLGLKLGVESGVPGATMGVYMFTGTLVWSAFADAVQRSTGSVLEHRNLVQKVRFDAQLLPLQVVLSSLVTFGAGLLAYFAYTALTSVWTAPGVSLLLWGPVLLGLQLLLTLGLGLGLSALQVLFRDTAPVVGVVLTIWMFVTPVFWVPSDALLPGLERWLPIVELNPVHHLLYAWREVLMSAEPTLVFNGDFQESVGILGVWALCAFVLGSLIFFRVERHMADEV